MKLAIIGSREYQNLNKVRDYVNSLPLDTIIISGGARGVDRVAEEAARARGMTVQVFLPDFRTYPGHIAPLVRNKEIVDAAEELVAFWDGKSTGTQHTLALARQRGLRHTVFL